MARAFEASHERLTAGVEAAGQRLDRWLASLFPGESRARIKTLIDSGAVRLDGRQARPAGKLRPGQVVEVDWPAPKPSIPRPEPIPLAVVHEDSSLIVVDKPAGLVVHPGAGSSSGTLVNALLHHVSDLSGIGGVLRPGIVHRLDRGTSGLLVVAKDDLAHRALQRQFAERTVEKEYLALVLGVPRERAKTIDAAIGRHPTERVRMAVRRTGGRSAVTSYRVLEAWADASLLKVLIHTGRTHQIRVHMASVGHPVAGDKVYGGTRFPKSISAESREALCLLHRPALHAARLCFDHPRTSQRLCFESPTPPDILDVVERLRKAPV